MTGSTSTTCLPAYRALHPARKDAYLESEELQDAVIRNVEVNGEAAKQVSAGSRSQLPSLDWRAICGMRDVLIHDYIGVDVYEVWNVAVLRVPELQVALEKFLASSGS